MKHLSLITLFILLNGLAAQGGAARGEAADEAEFGPAFSHHVALAATSAGSYTLSGQIGGTNAEFLLDTGASMVTISRELFAQIRGKAGVVSVGKAAARTASGKLEMMNVYKVESFKLGEHCELGPTKVAVLASGGRNLLGMSALSQAAPFAVYTSPPALGLSRCGQPLGVVSR